MAENKPFGWRPYTQEHRAELSQSGFDDATIDRMEASNVYSPVDNAVIGYEVAAALLFAGAKRLGAEFVHDVRSELERRISKSEASEHVEDHVEAKIMREFIANSDFDAIMNRASTDGG